MRSSTFLAQLLPLIIIFFFIIIINASASIDETCKFIAAAQPAIGYEFCVRSISSDPSSNASDTTLLAVVATKISIANATRFSSKISWLMKKSKSDPPLKDCLSVCSEVYFDVIYHLHDAVANLDSKSYKEAATYLSVALHASDNCEGVFVDEEESPIQAEDRVYGKLADITLTIAASLG